MKKVTLILVMALMGLVGYAQDAQALKYGYLSYDSVFKAMPEYATMQASMQTLRDKYEAEQKRVEDDFNKKYEEFLDGLAGYPPTILQKRQSELQEMLDKNVLKQVGEERGYAFILNTDGNVAPWLNAAMGEDVTETVKELLK